MGSPARFTTPSAAARAWSRPSCCQLCAWAGIELQALQALTSQGGEGIQPTAHQGELVAEFQEIGNQLASHKSGTAQKQQPHAQFMP
jgi:hypothetical protein